MKYLDNGAFKIEIPKTGMFNVMQRALYNKVFNIDVFLNKDKMMITARDLSGDIIYILKEQEIGNQNLKAKELDYIASEKNIEDLNKLFDIDTDFTDIGDFDLDNLDDNYEELSEESDNKKVNLTEEDINLTWNETSEINKEESEDKSDEFGINILANSLNKDKSNEDNVEIGESAYLSKQIVDITSEINIGEEVCRFSTSINLLKVLPMFKSATIKVEEDKITLVSEEYMTVLTFPRIKSYTDLESYNNILKEIKWEEFPAQSVKSIMPLLDRIEPDKKKQRITLNNGQIYMYSDTMAISANIKRLIDNYELDQDMLRLLKYATSKWSKVYIGLYKNGLAFNIDGLVVVYPIRIKEQSANLIDLLNEDKLLLSTEYSTQWNKIVDMITTMGGENSIKVSFGEKMGTVETERSKSLLPLISQKPFSFNINIELLKTAVKLTGTKNPKLNFYVLKGNKIILVFFNKDLRILIEGESLRML